MSTYQLSGPASASASRRVIGSPGGTSEGFWGANSVLTTALTGANNDLTYTAKSRGLGGNSITIAYVVAGASTPLSVSVTGTAITVNVATNGSSVATSTAAQVKAAVDAHATASLLVQVANAAGNDGTGVVTALSTTPLAGGTANTYGNSGNAGPLPTQHPIHDSYR